MRNRERQRANRRLKRMLERQNRTCNRSDCASCKDGYCNCLDRTDFGGKPCPFFKTGTQVKQEQTTVLARLNQLGRYDLIEKHYGGDNCECQ